jgi:hypothetical protein
MSFWSQYSDKSFGKVIHFIYCYCGFNIAESCQIGEHTVMYGNKIIAKDIKWEEHTYKEITVWVPVFIFIDENHKKSQEYFINEAVVELSEFKKLAGDKWIEYAIETKNNCTNNYNNSLGYIKTDVDY